MKWRNLNILFIHISPMIHVILQCSLALLLTAQAYSQWRPVDTDSLCRSDRMHPDSLSSKNSNDRFPNPSKYRYLLTPSAINPGRGEGYFQNSLFIYNSIQLGITNHISVVSGITIVPKVGIGGTGSELLFFAAPKAEFKIGDLLHTGAGVLYVTYAGSGTGYAYGLATLGSEEHNITAGAAWGILDCKYPGRPVLTLSGMMRISRKLGFVTDNWWIPKDKNREKFFSYGMRYFWENACVDVAFINNREISEFIGVGFPYIDLVLQF